MPFLAGRKASLISPYQTKGKMYPENEIPLLLSFYFGPSAVSAQRGASKRLKKWARAFEQWVTERKRVYPKITIQKSVRAFQRLVRQCGKLPWEVTREDIAQHAAWMEQQGFAAVTINSTLGFIASFFHWCETHRIDPPCPP